jgi:hypothetical protein
MALIDDFKARFPEFDSAKVDEIVPTLDGVWQCYYGGDYENPCDKEAVLMLMAHLFVEESSPGTEGPKETTNKAVGNVSVGFASGAGGAMNRLWPHFGSSKYGKRFMLLINKNSGAVFV